ncbi:MAG: hypothetical protein R3A79_18375 [Nannocystaceae bacterium]
MAVTATVGCRPSEGDTESGTSATTGESATSSAASTGTSAATDSSAATSETSGMISDMAGEGALCSLILQDCPENQKCVAYNADGGILPDGVKCVDEHPNPDGVGEPCMNLGNFGSGEDTCVKGAMCFDLDNDGAGSCVAHCSGIPEDPQCPSEETCVTFFDPPVPLCFASCDPFLQDCPEGEGCYMDAPNIGSEGFVCMPTVLAPNENGDYGDLCYNQAGCAPGFSCIWPENVPNCKYEYCCSPWCDLEVNPELCTDLHPTMECVPWYNEGEAQPGLENLGICGIPL